MPVVSGGGSPALKGCGDFPMLTEYRAGTYIYNDVMQVTAGAATWDDCAMTVRATVVSRPTEDRAVLDAGSKVMTYEQYYAKGFGRIVEYPGRAGHRLLRGARHCRPLRLARTSRRSAKWSA